MAAMLTNSSLVKKGGLQMLFELEVLKMKEIGKRVQATVSRVGWFLLLSLVILFSLSSAQAQAPTEVEKTIALRAGQLGLGAPLPETPRPRQVATSPVEVWVQAFSGGRVYYLRQPGVPASNQFFGTPLIRGEFLTRWLAEGGDGGSLGFPLSDEQVCPNSTQRDRFQWFRHGLIHWRPETKDMVIHIVDPLGLFSNRPQICRPAPEEEAGRFRVILTGFSVNRQTNDNILESDGKGDEVFIVAEVAQYDHRWAATGYYRRAERERSGQPILSGRRPLSLRRTLTSILMGDANNQEAPRIAAGTATNNGGLRTGDHFPKEPWKLTGTPSANRLPMLVWEGELRHGMVIIVPTIWEWDDGNVRAREQFVKDIEIHFNFGTYQDDGLVARGVGASDIAGAGDRPIAGLGDPSSIRLDFPTAAAAVQQSVKHGPGVFEIQYQGETEHYTLYYKIERMR